MDEWLQNNIPDFKGYSLTTSGYMIVRRSILFLSASLLVIVPLVVNKMVWMPHTNITTGILSFEGMGNAPDLLRSTYSVVSFKHGDDTIWFQRDSEFKLQTR